MEYHESLSIIIQALKIYYIHPFIHYDLVLVSISDRGGKVEFVAGLMRAANF
jgi:hypothetical protein